MTAAFRVEDAPPLGVNEVHLWRIPPDDGRVEPPDMLEPVERDRALRFRFESDRNRFVQRRVAIRRLLGCYCGTDPAHVRFSLNAYGKPSMVREGATPHFNLSHTPGLALLAITRDGPLGVDVERIRRTERAMEVARGLFSPGEVASLARLPEEKLQLAFLRCWTRKEAVVKALGMGLSLSLDSFDVSVGAVGSSFVPRG